MTPWRIRYIIQGLKKEIARESDRTALITLARMGLYYNRLLIMGEESKVCRTCLESLPIECFELIETSYTKRDGHVSLYAFYRPRCKKCVNKRGWEITKKKRRAARKNDIQWY